MYDYNFLIIYCMYLFVLGRKYFIIRFQIVLFWIKRNTYNQFHLPVINGEKAVFNIPVFAQKREKTLDMMIKRIIEQYLTDIKVFLRISSFSLAILSHLFYSWISLSRISRCLRRYYLQIYCMDRFLFNCGWN